MLMEMRTSVDAELNELLGVESGWTDFLYRQLNTVSWKGDGGLKDDMFTDIVNSIIINLHSEKSHLYLIAEKIKATTVGDDEARLNGMQRMLNRAVRLRFRDYRREVRFDIGQHIMPHHDEFDGRYDNTIPDNRSPEHDIEAADMESAIRSELNRRASNSTGFANTVLKLAIQFFPDRCLGLGLRDLCEKHGERRGRKTLLALKEIISAAEAVVDRVGAVVP